MQSQDHNRGAIYVEAGAQPQGEPPTNGEAPEEGGLNSCPALQRPSATVIIVTLNRPEYLERCLNCLFAQREPAEQVVVVDASTDDRSRDVVYRFAGVVYLRNEHGYGHMTESRNLGLAHATGDVAIFIDDDAFVHAGWLDALLTTYADPAIGAVGGRALNPGTVAERSAETEIGRLKPDGTITSNFDLDPGRTIDVDHVIGCNMSFRMNVLAELGGFRPEYPGTEVREETDLCLRVKQLGYRLAFNPAAVVDHITAPQMRGRRADLRYLYYGNRNHTVLLLRNFGPFSGIFLRDIVRRADLQFRRVSIAVLRTIVVAAATAVGTCAGLLLVLRKGRDPLRRDHEGRALSEKLRVHGGAPGFLTQPQSNKG